MMAQAEFFFRSQINEVQGHRIGHRNQERIRSLCKASSFMEIMVDMAVGRERVGWLGGHRLELMDINEVRKWELFREQSVDLQMV